MHTPATSIAGTFEHEKIENLLVFALRRAMQTLNAMLCCTRENIRAGPWLFTDDQWVALLPAKPRLDPHRHSMQSQPLCRQASGSAQPVADSVAPAPRILSSVRPIRILLFATMQASLRMAAALPDALGERGQIFAISDAPIQAGARFTRYSGSAAHMHWRPTSGAS